MGSSSDAAEARTRCNELGSNCSGITCEDVGESQCSVRAGLELQHSPYGEVTYRKWQDGDGSSSDSDAEELSTVTISTEGPGGQHRFATLPAELPVTENDTGGIFQMY